MDDEPVLGGQGEILALTDDERQMLREFAETLRIRDVRNPVAREALDRAAEHLERAALAPPEGIAEA